jgi:hypothetical protein
MIENLLLRGRRFDMTLRQGEGACGWQWMLAAPGELVLSGEEPNAELAVRSARRAGRLLARLKPERVGLLAG